jgi:RNA polymerase sigma-70 factor (ECF subfamily)
MDNGNMEVKMIRQEFIDFIEKEGKAVYSFCHAMTRNRENADELYQEVMLVAVERCKDMEASNNPKSYLINIAVRLYKNYRRKYARRQRIAPVVELTEELSAVLKDNSIDLEEEVMLQEQRRIIKEETLNLPEKLRLTVYLFYTAQLSVEEIATTLHIPCGTVKSRLHKARSIMKKRLEDYGYED